MVVHRSLPEYDYWVILSPYLWGGGLTTRAVLVDGRKKSHKVRTKVHTLSKTKIYSLLMQFREGHTFMYNTSSHYVTSLLRRFPRRIT